MIALEPVQPLSGTPAQVRLCLLRECQKVLGVAPTQIVGPVRLLDSLGGVLADCLQHREPRLLLRAFYASEAAVGKRGEPVDDVEAVSAHALGGAEGASARKHSEPGEQLLLLRLQQVVAPVDRRANRALALGQVSGAALQELETVVEPLEHRLWRQHADAGGGKLDRQRQALERFADLGNRSGVRGRDDEIRPDRACARREQCNRLALEEPFHVVGAVRRLERGNCVHALAGEMKRNAARHQELQRPMRCRRCRRQEVRPR